MEAWSGDSEARLPWVAEAGVEDITGRLIQLSFAKILHSKQERGGARLHKNLLILHLLKRARDNQRSGLPVSPSHLMGGAPNYVAEEEEVEEEDENEDIPELHLIDDEELPEEEEEDDLVIGAEASRRPEEACHSDSSGYDSRSSDEDDSGPSSPESDSSSTGGGGVSRKRKPVGAILPPPPADKRACTPFHPAFLSPFHQPPPAPSPPPSPTPPQLRRLISVFSAVDMFKAS